LFSIGQNKQYVENVLTSWDKTEVATYHRLHTFQRVKKSSAFFAFWKTENRFIASALFDADKDLNILDLRDIIFEWEYRDKDLSHREFRMIRGAVKQNFPKSLYDQIDWSPWEEFKKQRVKARVLITSVLYPEALRALGNISIDRLKQDFENYLRSIPTPRASPTLSDQTPEELYRNLDIVEKYREDIYSIVVRLEKIFDQSGTVTALEKSEAWASLRFSELFIEVGLGFLLSLLPEEHLSDLIYSKFSLVADEEKPINYEHGQARDTNVYQAASYIRAVLSERNVDLALELAR
jgi:hypothetical protein